MTLAQGACYSAWGGVPAVPLLSILEAEAIRFSPADLVRRGSSTGCRYVPVGGWLFRRLSVFWGVRAFSRDLRVNQEIRVREVRLVDDEGRQLGVMPVRDAMRLAGERGLDLVEVAPTASPPVCRIMDYGRFKYEQDKREREARKKQHIIEIKELVLRPNIDEHDLLILARKGERFLRDGDKLKLTMRFKGREITHPDLGRQVFSTLLQHLGTVGNVEAEPRLEGRTMVMVMAPKPEVLHAVRQQSVGPTARPAGAPARPGAEQADAAVGAATQPGPGV